MQKEIPDFLLEMSKQMNEQDNRCTADPIWQVRYKSYLVTERGYNENHWEIVNTEDGTNFYHSEKDSDYTGLFLYLLENQPDWLIDYAEYVFRMDVRDCSGEIDEDYHDKLLDKFNETFNPDHYDLPDTLEKLHLQEIEEVVSTHLTEDEAIWAMKRRQQDYPELELYTDVASAYWSPQIIELRQWVMGLTKED